MNETEIDYVSTQSGANMLAEMIRQYWARRGLFPDVWVDKIAPPSNKDAAVWQVRSNMLNGMPNG